MIEVSVTIPLLRSKYIAWLCFEGLARQQGINHHRDPYFASQNG
jgi:hypothetical protein